MRVFSDNTQMSSKRDNSKEVHCEPQASSVTDRDVRMCNQMVTSEIRKLFPNFTSIPFDYLLISWVTNYTHNLGVLTCLSHREHLEH